MGESKNIPGSQVALIVAAACVVWLAWWYFMGGGQERHAVLDSQRATLNVSDIELQVAHDAETQYEIAKRSGTATDACWHAQLAATAYLQVKNEAQFKAWKKVEKDDCKLAGMPESS